MTGWFGKQPIAVRAIIVVLAVSVLGAPLCVAGGALGYYLWVRKGPAKTERNVETEVPGEDEEDTVAPFLSIYEPKSVAATDQKQVTVKGRAEAGCRLTANDADKKLATDGTFSFVADLSPGANNIVLVVVDKSGNKTSRQVCVTYNPPAPSPPPATSPGGGGGGGGGGGAPAPSAPSICGNCSGVGLVLCPECGGAGGVLCPNGPCPDCGWLGFYPCGTCGGGLYITCPDCGGTGQT